MHLYEIFTIGKFTKIDGGVGGEKVGNDCLKESSLGDEHVLEHDRGHNGTTL